MAYTKTSNYTFNSVYELPDEEYAGRFRFDDNDGRGLYQSVPIDSPNPRPNLTYDYKGFRPPANGWRFSIDIMRQLDEDGKLIFPKSKEGRIRKKVYLAEALGPKVGDVWTDIAPLQGQSAEKLGYPTQKPVELLERIIAASSNKGDVILDPFCGCGTAISAAQRLGRKWIGIDITHLSVTLQKYRLRDEFDLKAGIDYKVVGEPTKLEDARALAKDSENDGRYQFQFWALGLVQAKPLGAQEGSKQGKKGSDKGIDGIISFFEGQGAQKVIVQVKSGKVKSGDIRDLVGTIGREKAAIGVFLTLEPPSRDMETEAVSAGYFRSNFWGKDNRKLQIFSIEDLLKGNTIEMPPQQSAFKQAQRVQEDLPNQKRLDL